MHVQVAFPSVLCSRRGVAPAHAHLSHSAFPLCISSGFQETRIIYIFQHLLSFWDLRPLWCRPHQSKPAQLTHTSLPAAGATAVHQTGVRYTLCSFYGSCWCLTFTHTSAQQCALYLLIWVFTQAADTERVRTSSLAYTFCARPNRRAQAYHYTPTSPQVMSLA